MIQQPEPVAPVSRSLLEQLIDILIDDELTTRRVLQAAVKHVEREAYRNGIAKGMNIERERAEREANG